MFFGCISLCISNWKDCWNYPEENHVRFRPENVTGFHSEGNKQSLTPTPQRRNFLSGAHPLPIFLADKFPSWRISLNAHWLQFGIKMEFVLPKRTLWFTFEIPPGKFGWFSKETHCTFGVKYDNHPIHTSYKPVLSCWFCHRRAHTLHSKHGILYLGFTRNLSFVPRDKDSE